MLIDLHDKVSPARLESALHLRHPYTVESGWSPQLLTEGLVIDLSKVRWIEPGTLVRVLLLIEGAVLYGATVTLRLPLTYPSQAERRVLDLAMRAHDEATRTKAAHIAAYVKRRKEAAAVLAKMRLRQVLAHDHIQQAQGRIVVLEGFDTSREQGQDADALADVDIPAPATTTEISLPGPWYFQLVYGMQWVATSDPHLGRSELDRLADVDVLAGILTHKSGRIAAADGRTLAHVFLKELAENVHAHSEREYALVVAWTRPSGVRLQDDEIFDCEKAFAANCAGFPLIEMVVGDSGRGIPATLAEEYRRLRPHLSHELATRTEEEQILVWAFDKWSSRAGVARPRRGTRGLYRVERIVRKYDGCETVRSERSYVGLDCLSQERPLRVLSETRLARAPGTVVQVRLPVMLADRAPERHARPRKRSRLTLLDCAGFDWSDERDAATQVFSRVMEECARASVLEEPACVIADLGFASLMRETLEELIEQLVEVAHPVAVVLANIKEPTWDSCLEVLHSVEQTARRDRDPTSSAEGVGALYVRDAVLVHHADGRSAWVGLADETASYIERLWSDGDISRARLTELLPDQERRSELLRRLAESYHITARTEDGGVGLRFNQANIEAELTQAAAAELTSMVLNGRPPGVLSDAIYRTPSLELVSRFIDTESFLTGRVLERVTGTLARMCVTIDEVSRAEAIEIVADSKTSRAILTSFRRNLAMAGQRPVPVRIHQLAPSDMPIVREGSAIIVFSDLILTGGLIARMMSQVIRRKRTPAAVVTVVDARRATGNVRLLEDPIQLLRMARIALLAAPGAETLRPIVNISPIDHKPELDDETAEDGYQVAPGRLAQLIERSDSMYFEHVSRPNGRHFTIYLDGEELLGAGDGGAPARLSDVGEEVIQAFKDAVSEWQADGRAPDLICFPLTDRPSAAEVIAGVLSERLSVPVCAVNRAGEANSWRFPSRIDAPEPARFREDLFDEPARVIPARVVVVDWGSVTGRSVRELVRLAAAAGARDVLVVVFLSQLTLEEERSLAIVERVRSDLAGERSCDVRTRFLARLPIRSYDVPQCPHCRQLHRLDDEDRFYASELLRHFAEGSRARLAPRSLADVRDERRKRRVTQEGDSGRRLEVARFIEIARWRERLDRSAQWTGARQDLYDDLLQVESKASRGDGEARMRMSCLVQLLAAEWTRLKQEPLTLMRLRQKVAGLAADMAADPAFDRDERRDAIVVLRTASKEVFAERLPHIFERVIDDHELVSQVLYCAFTYLQRDYLMPASIEPLVVAVDKCVNTVDALLVASRPAAALSVGQTVNALQAYGTYLVRSRRGLSPVEAWRQLRELMGSRYQTHHPVCRAMQALRLGRLEKDLEEADEPPPAIDWAGLRDGWDNKCRPFILQELLPLLSPLRRVFEGLDSAVVVGKDKAEALALLEDGRGFFEISTLTHTLHVFVRMPEAVRRPGELKAFVRSRDWVWELFIDPGAVRVEGARLGGSALIRLIQGCPADLTACLRDIVASATYATTLDVKLLFEESETPLRVFCHTDVLHECIAEILRNAQRHAEPAGDQDRVPVEIRVASSHDHVDVTIHNGGRRRQGVEEHRLGLSMSAERLRPYDATLAIDPDCAASWLFGVRMSLVKA